MQQANPILSSPPALWRRVVLTLEMIRFEHSRAVTVGTMLRFTADAAVLAMALALRSIPGTAAATGMMVVGVITEAVYVGFRVRPVLRQLKPLPSAADKVLLRDMITFFIPLAIMPLLQQLVRPIGSAAISRRTAASVSPGSVRRSISMAQASGTMLGWVPPLMTPTLMVGGPRSGCRRWRSCRA